MTDRKALYDPNEPPEDVASLYSWANLHGAKYRDFSASRALNRERTRQRVQAIEEERARQQAEALHAEDIRRAEEAARADEQRRFADQAVAQQQAMQLAAQQAAQQAVQQVAQQSAQQAAQELARRAAEQAAQDARAAQAQAAQYAQSAQQAAQQAAWQPQRPDRFAQPSPYAPPQPPYAAPPPVPYAPPQPAPYAAQPPAPYSPPQPAAPFAASPRAPYPAAPSYPSYPAPQASRPVVQPAVAREDAFAVPAPSAWPLPETRELPARPAWLAERPESASSAKPHAPEDTIVGSRDRLTSRWFALKGIFDGPAGAAPAETAPAPVTARAPVLAVFSLAGGVGKTSLAATLGRALSARGERVLLVDTSAFGLLPFFFGARDQRPGQLRTFSPPAASGDAPIQMIAIDPDSLGPENAAQDPLSGEIVQHARGMSRIIVDLATASGAITRRILKLSPLVLVPVTPDMNSVVSVGSIDAFFQHTSGASGKLPYYVLNQFDPSLPLHLDVREVLREQLGDRLLPFALRRSPAVSEALAEGMTVMDYAPSSTVAEDFGSLAGWVKSLSAPASGGFRGVRWSER